MHIYIYIYTCIYLLYIYIYIYMQGRSSRVPGRSCCSKESHWRSSLFVSISPLTSFSCFDLDKQANNNDRLNTKTQLRNTQIQQLSSYLLVHLRRMSEGALPYNRSSFCRGEFWPRVSQERPISLLRLSLLRFVDSKHPGNSLWT